MCNGRRVYYEEVPTILQVGEHQFVERRVVDYWIMQMLLSWYAANICVPIEVADVLSRTSATNCAQLYNHTLARPPHQSSLPTNWPYSFNVQSWHVWDAFVILSLLEYRRDYRLGVLDIPHGGSQRDRFKEAMRERNAHVRLCGLGQVPHWCFKCTRFWDRRPEGQGIGVFLLMRP